MIAACHLQVFVQGSSGAAGETVAALSKQGIVVDCRGCSVRIGFGLNHSLDDVQTLLQALADDAADS